MRAAERSRDGIIPADAGSTLELDAWTEYIWDHPRGCGEHEPTDLADEELAGSSPRMRGAPEPGTDTTTQTRIIPADAGSTFDDTGTGKTKRDHPRGCGEHTRQAGGPHGMLGSSPRMRGAPGRCSLSLYLCRIIPADAGSTSVACLFCLRAEDHPRGCGEHFETKK